MTNQLLVGALLVGSVVPQDTVEMQVIGPALWADISLDRQWSIGGVDGHPNEIFGNVSDVEVDCLGNVWVADTRPPMIKVFDAAGGFVRTVGREGQGPGEYRQLSGLEPYGECGIALYDHANGLITVYEARTGEVSLTERVEGGAFRVGAVARSTESGLIYTWTLIGAYPERRQAWVGHILTNSTEPVDSIIPPLPMSEGPDFTARTPFGNMKPFTTETLHAVTPMGLMWARNDEYSVHLLRDGQVLRLFREIEPVELLPQERRQWIEIKSRFEAQAPDIEGSDYSAIPDVKPVIKSIGGDWDGRVWIGRYVRAVQSDGRQDEAGWWEPPVYDVVSTQGRLLGQVELGLGQRLMRASGRDLYVVERGQFDEQYLVKLTIASSGEREGH